MTLMNEGVHTVNSDESRGSLKHEIESKAAQIARYKQLYYLGKAVVPDDVYDELENELRRLDPHHPVLTQVGYTPLEDVPTSGRQEKVSHDPPMLSLSKSYEPEELGRFVRDMGRVCITDKLDGMALSLEYDTRGFLERASTRGNGLLGENVTRHVHLIPAIPKYVPELSKRIGNRVFEVRGEVFFPLAAFSAFEDRFESFRNAVPGTFGRKDPLEAEDVLSVLGFCAYDLIVKQQDQRVPSHEALGYASPSHYAKLSVLESVGFWSGIAAGATRTWQPEELMSSPGGLESYLSESFSKERPYAIDGLVVRCDDDQKYESLGNTSHHPRGSLAFKQAGETAVTRLVHIHMGVGRSGKISFRAELDPVFLSGATITYATLHNAEFIEIGNYAPGASVRIKRSGEVIPYIIGLESPSADKYQLPQACLCGSPLSRKGPDLYCLDNPKCTFRDSEALLHFVKALGIYGLSEKLLERFKSAGLVSSPADLFEIRVEDLRHLEGFGEKSAQNIIESIEAKKALSLDVFLTSLGLRRGGKVKCQEVASVFRSLDRVLALRVEELEALPGWARKSAQEFLDSLAERRSLIDELLHFITINEPPEETTLEAHDHPLRDKKICITGALSRPRSVYEKILSSIGAHLASSVSQNTDFLVCNEASTSSKYRKALELGVPVMSEDALIEALGELVQ